MPASLTERATLKLIKKYLEANPLPQPPAYLTINQLKVRWSVSKMWIERRIHEDPRFPKPRRFDGGRNRFWAIKEVEDYEDAVLIRDDERV
jgi:hypothetical protein